MSPNKVTIVTTSSVLEEGGVISGSLLEFIRAKVIRWLDWDERDRTVCIHYWPMRSMSI